MYACPHCGGPGISVWRKLRLGPRGAAKCNTCGRAIGIGWFAMLALIPFIAAITFAYTHQPLLTRVAVLAIGVGLMCVLHLKCFPLVPR